MKLNKIGSLQIVLSSACFGALPLLTKISYDGGANVVTILAVRFLIASCIIWPYIWVTKTKIEVNLKQLAVFAVMGIFGYGVMAATYFISLHYIPSSMAAMIMFVYPVLVTYFSTLVLKSRITRGKVIALLLVSGGAIIMAWGGGLAFHPLGVILALTAAFFYALYIVYLGSRFTYQQEPKVLAAFLILFSGIFFTLFGIVRGDLNLNIDISAWQAIIFMAIVSTVFAIMVFYSGVRKIGPSVAAIISTVEPVTALILGLLVLGEKLCFNQWMGAFLIVIGVIYVQLPKAKTKIDWKTRI